MLSIVGMLSVPMVFMRPPDLRKQADEAHANFAHADGDHLTLLNVYHAYKGQNMDSKWAWENFVSDRALRQADNVRQQLARLMQKSGLVLESNDFSSSSYYLNIRKCLVEGFFMQVAHLEKSNVYETVKDQQAVGLHPSTCLADKPAWVLYNEFVLTSKNYIRTVTRLEGEWLLQIAPQYYDLRNFPDGSAKRALASLISVMARKNQRKQQQQNNRGDDSD